MLILFELGTISPPAPGLLAFDVDRLVRLGRVDGMERLGINERGRWQLGVIGINKSGCL